MAEDEVGGWPRGLGRGWEVVGAVGWWGGIRVEAANTGKGEFFFFFF